MPAREPLPIEKSTIGRLVFPTLRVAGGIASRVAPEAAARWAERHFLTPRRHRRPPREEAWLAGARRFTVEADGRSLAAWEWGRGPAVALVHGWEGRGSQLGAFALALAAAGFRAVAFDAPGHGDSPGDSSSLVEIAGGLAAVATARGPLAGVIAHSAGAAATTFALARGVDAERVVFVAPPADFDGYARGFGALFGFSPEVVGRMRRRIERRFDVAWSDLEPLSWAPSLEVPLLVVHDRDDHETPLAGGRLLARAWPEAELVVTHGLGHRRILRQPEVVAGAVEYLDAAAGAVAAAGADRRASAGARASA